jgi:hypothetical protein
MPGLRALSKSGGSSVCGVINPFLPGNISATYKLSILPARDSGVRFIIFRIHRMVFGLSIGGEKKSH